MRWRHAWIKAISRPCYDFPEPGTATPAGSQRRPSEPVAEAAIPSLLSAVRILLGRTGTTWYGQETL